jgi:hypothetical protein
MWDPLIKGSKEGVCGLFAWGCNSGPGGEWAAQLSIQGPHHFCTCMLVCHYRPEQVFLSCLLELNSLFS